MVMKKLVFGIELYAPAAMCDSSPRYAVEPVAEELMVIKKLVFGEELYAPALTLQLEPR